MSEADKVKRVEFAQKMQENYPPTVWTETVAFYLDGVSFVYKTNPMDEARAPKGRLWRKNPKVSNKGAWLRGVKLEREEDGSNKSR